MSLTFTAAGARSEAQDRVREIVQHSGDRLKVAFAAVGRRLGGMRPGRVKQIYYGEAGAVRAEEMDAIRALHTRFAEIIEEQRAIERRMREITGDAPLDRDAPDGAVPAQGCRVAGTVPPAGPDARPADREG